MRVASGYALYVYWGWLDDVLSLSLPVTAGVHASASGSVGSRVSGESGTESRLADNRTDGYLRRLSLFLYS